MPIHKSATANRRGSTRVDPLSPDCRCQCSAVCMIKGPASIQASKTATVTATYTLELNVAQNDGCEKGFNHESTAWALTVGPPLAGKVKKKKKADGTDDETKTMVKIEVDKNCPEGQFILQANPTVKCTCKKAKPPKPVVLCGVQGQSVTLKVLKP